ncbi:MAG: branched-chain amino acid ABC transporter permease [Promethearchaeota archaeon]
MVTEKSFWETLATWVKKKVVLGIIIIIVVVILAIVIPPLVLPPAESTDFIKKIVETIIFGSSLGTVLALISIGYSLVYGVGKIINLSHGMYYFLTGYLIFSFSVYGPVPYPYAIILSLIIITVIGACTYLFLIKPFHGKEIMVMIITFSLGFLIQQIILLVELLIPGYTFLSLDRFIPGSYIIFGAQFTFYRLFIMIVSVLTIATLLIFIKKTRYGKAIRAVSQDQDAAKLMGINYNGVLLFTVTISAFLAGFAAFLYVPEEPLSMTTGWNFLLLSMSVVILGGMGSISGTLIGAFILAFSKYLCQYFISEPLAGVFHLFVIIVMLVIRPYGILGKKEKI